MNMPNLELANQIRREGSLTKTFPTYGNFYIQEPYEMFVDLDGRYLIYEPKDGDMGFIRFAGVMEV